MNTINKQAISDALREAILRANLSSGQTARILNLNPCYISMAQNKKCWNSMGKASWLRLEEWINTREPLSGFVIPEGEIIWKPKEKEKNEAVKEAVFAKKTDEEKKEKPVNTSAVPDPAFCVSRDEKLQEAYNEIARLEKEVEELVCLTKAVPDLDTSIGDIIRQKLAVDIEINLVINGQRLHIG